jgi:hypothetical protein
MVKLKTKVLSNRNKIKKTETEGSFQSQESNNPG